MEKKGGARSGSLTRRSKSRAGRMANLAFRVCSKKAAYFPQRVGRAGNAALKKDQGVQAVCNPGWKEETPVCDLRLGQKKDRSISVGRKKKGGTPATLPTHTT